MSFDRAMKVTITLTDIADGKVDITCDVQPPDVVHNEPCEISRHVAWFMLFAAERILNNTPVRRVFFPKLTNNK